MHGAQPVPRNALPSPHISGYVVPVATLIYLTAQAPSRLANDLMLAGHTVFEALEVSEALHLCESQHVDAIVIGADVEDPDLIEVQMRCATLRLKPQATAGDVVWELAQLFPDNGARIQ